VAEPMLPRPGLRRSGPMVVPRAPGGTRRSGLVPRFSSTGATLLRTGTLDAKGGRQRWTPKVSGTLDPPGHRRHATGPRGRGGGRVRRAQAPGRRCREMTKHRSPTPRAGSSGTWHLFGGVWRGGHRHLDRVERALLRSAAHRACGRSSCRACPARGTDPKVSGTCATDPRKRCSGHGFCDPIAMEVPDL